MEVAIIIMNMLKGEKSLYHKHGPKKETETCHYMNAVRRERERDRQTETVRQRQSEGVREREREREEGRVRERGRT